MTKLKHPKDCKHDKAKKWRIRRYLGFYIEYILYRLYSSYSLGTFCLIWLALLIDMWADIIIK